MDLAVTDWPGFTETVIPAERIVLAVEITSPSNAGDDRVLKPEQYGRAGIPHYLRIDLDRDSVDATVYMLTGGAYRTVATADQASRLHLDAPFPVALELETLVSQAHLPRRAE